MLSILLPRSWVAIGLRHWLHLTNCEWEETTADFSLRFFRLNWRITLAGPRTSFADKVEWRLERWVISLSWMTFSNEWRIWGYQSSFGLFGTSSSNVHWMRDVHRRDNPGTWIRMFVWYYVDRLWERVLEWTLVDISIAPRSWGSWSAVSTLRRMIRLDSMLAGLFVPFGVRIQFDATMERHEMISARSSANRWEWVAEGIHWANSQWKGRNRIDPMQKLWGAPLPMSKMTEVTWFISM